MKTVRLYSSEANRILKSFWISKVLYAEEDMQLPQVFFRFDKDITTAYYFTKKGKIRYAIAKRSRKDKYKEEIGKAVAKARLFNWEIPYYI